MVGTLRSVLSGTWEQAGGRSSRSNQLRHLQQPSPLPNRSPRPPSGPASAPTTRRCGDRAREVGPSRTTQWSTISMSALRVPARAARRPASTPWRCCCCGPVTRLPTHLRRRTSAPGSIVGRPSGFRRRAQPMSTVPAAIQLLNRQRQNQQDQNQRRLKRSMPVMQSAKANRRHHRRSLIVRRLATIVSNECMPG
jgi:hypothetical protein